ncbi:glycosyltransferase family 2 protein [Photobacterium damselae subsp. damselae]
MNNKDKVSVIMSAYNAEEYIYDSIVSLLNQTYKNIEIIIIDDGSTDNTLDIINSFDDQRIICISRENKGLTKSLNDAIEISTGGYICRQDADDKSSVNRIYKQLKFIKEKECDIIFCQSFDGVSNIPSRLMLRDEISFTQLKFGNVLTHGCVFGKSQIFKQHQYDEEWLCGQDYELWLRLLNNGYKLYVMREPLYYLNRHSNSISSKRSEEQENFAIKAIDKNKGNNFWFIRKNEPMLMKYFKRAMKRLS